MLKRVEWLVLLGISAVFAGLVIVNMVLILGNRAAQTEIQGRAQFIQQSAQLEVLYREIVKALADLSVRQQDKDLSALLSNHGITVTVNAPAAGAVVPTAASEPARKGGAK